MADLSFRDIYKQEYREEGLLFDGELSQDEGESGEEPPNEEDVGDSGEESFISFEDERDEDEAEEAQEESKRRAELREMMSEQQKAVVAFVSQSAAADVEKGKAVKQQRSTFDALLNTRIRLQKAIIATNSFDTLEDHETIRAAEEAALRLWTSLNDLRQNISTAKTTKPGDKRKRNYDTATSSWELWNAVQDYEPTALSQRRATLEKWSSKVRGATTLPLSKRLNNTAAQQTITDVLTEQLSNPERLIKRTQVPRSCAPVQASIGVHEAPEIFDDADFYQLLLKELVDQRMVDNTTSTASLQNGAAQWQAAREARTKKNVDTKASKARKLRYTVHEKLQNFMAPEDRGSWSTRQTDELFGSLLGRKMGLGEDMALEDSEKEDLGEAGLMLFRG
ncbi:MAG: rRNA-processing protein bfr2 [Candelina submexicana]|nr:MAG: rRNA-processing protein bfr2 [Candelina submexicana]